MNRLAAIFALLSLLLFAAAPAHGVMLRTEKTAVPDFFWPPHLASGDECPASQDRIRDAAIYGYDFASDVRVGPNLYAYVRCNPWTKWDPLGLATTLDGENKPRSSTANKPDSLKPSEYSKNETLNFETGGEDYYNKNLRKPSYPGGASGATIGVGYDLGYNSKEQIKEDWGERLSPKEIERLQEVSGKTGSAAKEAVKGLKDIDVPLGSGKDVFEETSIPKFSDLTKKTFPGSTDLPPHSQGALLSLVFNRGTSTKGDSRKEMRQIRDAISQGKPEKVPQLIRDMKRLWEGKNLDGLLLRRDAEADMFQAGLDLRNIENQTPP